MSSASFKISFDGSQFSEHTMNVEQLAPSMLALADLCKHANRDLNPEGAEVNLLVKSNFEQHCFEITFHCVQTFWDNVKGLLANDDIKSAKDLIEWLGLFGTAATGFLGYLRLRNGRPIQSKTEINIGELNIVFANEKEPVRVPKKIYEWGENRKMKSSVVGFLSPLNEEGIDSITIKDEHDKEVERIEREDNEKIRSSCALPSEGDPLVEPLESEVWLHVYGPIFDKDVNKWRFTLFDRAITVDISDTDLAEKALRTPLRFGDRYHVILVETPRITPTGQIRHDYKIKEILDFKPGEYQSSLKFS